MKFYSTSRQSPSVGLQQAVMLGMAPDGGLYMPERIPQIPKAFFNNISSMSLRDIAFVVADQMMAGELPSAVVRDIVNSSFTFDIPLVQVSDDVYSLELFHGPTRAFKDIGARFLARVMSHYSSQMAGRKVKVLVATSGDSGAAVADGFHGVTGVETYILYPSGGLTRAQVSRLNMPGSSVHPIEVLGTFDDCQMLERKAFVDESLHRDFVITSANSINICRLLPQMFYFFHAYASLVAEAEREGHHLAAPVVVSIPSGNLGNLTAALLAIRMGLPVDRLVVANNANDAAVRFLAEGRLCIHRSMPTVARAMDVANPSNLPRIADLFAADGSRTPSSYLHGYSLADSEILSVMADTWRDCRYMLDPHSATALGALRSDMRPGEKGIFLATAHPSKSPRVVREAIGIFPDSAVADSDHHKGVTHPRISVSYDALRRIICSS